VLKRLFNGNTEPGLWRSIFCVGIEKNVAFQAGIVGMQRVGKIHMLGGGAPESVTVKTATKHQRGCVPAAGLMQEAVY
jgi:hypothetical protein